MAVNRSRAKWRKSSRSTAQGDCVEVAGLVGEFEEDVCAIRDSKDPDGPILVVGAADFVSFLSGLRQGKLR